MENLSLYGVIVSIFLFLTWQSFSVFAIIYWVKTPLNELIKIMNIDKTKGFVWWYGFVYTVILVVAILLSLVFFLGVSLWRSMNV